MTPNRTGSNAALQENGCNEQVSAVKKKKLIWGLVSGQWSVSFRIRPSFEGQRASRKGLKTCQPPAGSSLFRRFEKNRNEKTNENKKKTTSAVTPSARRSRKTDPKKVLAPL